MFSVRVLNVILAGSLSMGLLVPSAYAASEGAVYAFQGYPNDGGNPYASLIDEGGALYSTTHSGGANGAGTVFKITTKGAEKVLHSFGSASDGAGPFAGLINVAGVLYGTTSTGGTGSCKDGPFVGCGTVFKITKAGAETVLYSFKGGPSDGFYPYAGLIDVEGTLYGTTLLGGTGACESGCGTVFQITKKGVETVLYSFKLDGDGAQPIGGLIDVGGTLYGTTQYGGAASCPYGCGTVFKITTAGDETVLYSFKGGTDGALPQAGLINVGGTLYGTTEFGGNGNCNTEGIIGCGTVFKITTAGVETVMHTFKGGSDGFYPHAGLIDVGGTLYGTTNEGGATGNGTVFKVRP